MSVGGQGGATGAKGRDGERRAPRRRWRTLQNRIERARQFRRAPPGAGSKARRPDGNAPTVG